MRSIVGCLRFRIKRDTLVSLVDRLESDLQAAGKPTTLVQNILEVLTRHVAEVWGAAPPRGYSLPDMEGKPFCIFASGNEGPVLSPNPMLTVPGGPHGLPVGYAGLANPSTLADPLPHGLGWQLVYTGKTSEGAGRGLPIYWIVEYQDDTLLQHRTALRKAAAAKKTPQPALRVALTATDQRLGTETFVVVGCADYGEITKHPPESSPAAWTLVATGDDPDEVTRRYQIINLSTTKSLGYISKSNPDWVRDHPDAPGSIVLLSVPAPWDTSLAATNWCCRTEVSPG